MSEMKEYSREEVKETGRQQRKKLLIIHDKVYDVSVFLNEHPGGEEVLLDHSGKDASEDFDDVGHSSDALQLMGKYQIGEIIESERTNKEPKQGWVAGYDSKTPRKYVSGPGLPLLLLIGAIVALNLGLWFYSSGSDSGSDSGNSNDSQG